MTRTLLSRRQFLGSATAAVGLARAASMFAQAPPSGLVPPDLGFINGRIHTMDPANRIVSQVLIRNGRFEAVGNNAVRRGGGLRIIDLKGQTVIPGLIDAHNHIVLVGNRPGWHTPLEHVFTIPDAVAALKARASTVPQGEFITTVGPISAMQFDERRLPTLSELDAVGRPVFIQAAQGGARINTEGKAWLEARGITSAADGTFAGPAAGLALQALRKQLLTPATRKRGAHDALQYYATLGITTHRDCGAFQAEEPATGVASENTYTMHDPFHALHRDGMMPARLRIRLPASGPAQRRPPLPTLGRAFGIRFRDSAMSG
jgi:predicted amidohydrolase YtcJ